MPLIPTQAARVRKETLSVRISPTVRALLDAYCEFAACGREHVVAESILYTLKNDDDFQHWLRTHGNGDAEISVRSAKARNTSP